MKDEFTSLLEQAIKDGIESRDGLWATTRYGHPTIAVMQESHQKSYWLLWQQVCGHANTEILVHDGESYAQRAHQMTGPIIARYTQDDALTHMTSFLKTIPSRREALIAEIHPDTLRALIDETEHFPASSFDASCVRSPRNEWTGTELMVARQAVQYYGPSQTPWRTIDLAQDDVLQCVCTAHKRVTSSYALPSESLLLLAR